MRSSTWHVIGRGRLGRAAVPAGAALWSAIPGLCLDLVSWRRWHQTEAQARTADRGDSPAAAAADSSVTAYKAAHGPSQSYALLLALQGALQAITHEGGEQVVARHAAAGRALRAGVRALGLRVLADEANAASCSTCVVMPGDGFPTQEYMKTVWREHGIATAGGSQDRDEMGYAGSRVGLMGFVANLDSVCALLEAMEDVLPRFDVEIVPGAAVPAATKAYESVERYR